MKEIGGIFSKLPLLESFYFFCCIYQQVRSHFALESEATFNIVAIPGDNEILYYDSHSHIQSQGNSYLQWF